MSNLPSLRELEEAGAAEESAYARSLALSAPTFISIALDRSGSMARIQEQTIAGLNSYIESLSAEGVAGQVTLTLFDTDGWYPEKTVLERVWNALPIASVPPLTAAQYTPRGGTPLWDAIGRLIVETDRAATAAGAEKIVCVIQTDGQETSSEEFCLADIKQMIKSKQALGWLFIFLGADVSAFSHAEALGISSLNALTYSGKKSVDAFAALSRSTVSYAATKDVSLSAFTEAERVKASGQLGSGKR